MPVATKLLFVYGFGGAMEAGAIDDVDDMLSRILLITIASGHLLTRLPPVLRHQEPPVTTGRPPPGLTLAPDGVLSGTTFVHGPFTFTVTATITGAGWTQTTPQQVTMTVDPAPSAPVFTADEPPTQAVLGQPYSYTFVASGYPTPAFRVRSGALPTGLTLDEETAEQVAAGRRQGSVRTLV